jgi:hypothetical protein
MSSPVKSETSQDGYSHDLQCASCRDLNPAKIHGFEYQPSCKECIQACSGHKHGDQPVMEYMPIDVEGYRVCTKCEPAWIADREGAPRDFHPVGGVTCFTCGAKFANPCTEEVQFFPIDGNMSYICKNGKCGWKSEIEDAKKRKLTASLKRLLEEEDAVEKQESPKKLKMENVDLSLRESHQELSKHFEIGSFDDKKVEQVGAIDEVIPLHQD